MGAVLWTRGTGAVSHAAAARLYGVARFDRAPLEISMTRAKTGRGLELQSGRRLVVHRVDRHLHAEIQDWDGFPITTPARTLVDVAGKKHPGSEGCLDTFLRSDLCSVGQVWRLLEKQWMRGRRGVAITRDLLIPRTAGRAPTESDLEIDGLRLLREATLPVPVVAHPMQLPMYGSARLDLAYPDRKLDIELDSVLWHLDRAAFERDRRRDAELASLGWTVLRITWGMLRFERGLTRKLVSDTYHSLLVA